MIDNIEIDVLVIFSDNEDDDFIQGFLTLYTPHKLLGKGAFSNVF